jgi:hypothetical protein
MQEAVNPSVLASDLRPRLEFEVCAESISHGSAEQAADTPIFMRRSSQSRTQAIERSGVVSLPKRQLKRLHAPAPKACGVISCAWYQMEGYTVEEIAGRRGWVSRTVKRKLHLIRQIWAKELPP